MKRDYVLESDPKEKDRVVGLILLFLKNPRGERGVNKDG